MTPSFLPYNNRQVQIIFDIEELISVHHVARVAFFYEIRHIAL
jgi:hypothetical protein